MTNSKDDWKEIPSIEGLGVDWDYEPENPLGKRDMVRVASKDLRTILGVKKIPVKVVSKSSEGKGYLVDIATNGIAVLLNTRFDEGQLVKLGLFLGKQKVLSRAIVRSVMEQNGGLRTGMEFVDLEEEYKRHIDGLISSKVYKSL
ncbi:MAG: PilZ domain-containing protein [Desulforhopalus sp.]